MVTMSTCGFFAAALQALRTSLGCDREEGVALLRRERGSACKALQDALQVGAQLARLQVILLAGDLAMSNVWGGACSGPRLAGWLTGCVHVHALYLAPCRQRTLMSSWCRSLLKSMQPAVA